MSEEERISMIKDKKIEEGTMWADAEEYLKSIGKKAKDMSSWGWENIPLDKCDIYVFAKDEWVLIHKAKI